MKSIKELITEQENNSHIVANETPELIDHKTESINNDSNNDDLEEKDEDEEDEDEENQNTDNEDMASEKSSTKETVVELLKKSLNIHWQQTTTLTAQAEHLKRWGYTKLAEILKHDAIEEQEHASINIRRLEFFDADYQPIVVSPPTWKRHDIVAMIQYNLDSVTEAASVEKATISAARAVGDEITANMMIPLLQGSEDGIELYTGYLKLIDQMGLDNFLSIQT